MMGIIMSMSTSVTAAEIRAIRPVIRETPYGWLALAEPAAPIPVGVVGPTEDDVRESFREAVAAWARLRAKADPA